jgi:hypothetical protein
MAGTINLFSDEDEVVREVPVQRHEIRFDAPEGVTDHQFRTVVGAAYTAYTMDGVVPDQERIRALTGSRYTKKVISRIIDTENFKNAMLTRGVPWKNGDGLSAQQMYTLQILTNPTDRRELRAKLKSAGVTYPQYRAWLNQPHFARYLSTVTENMLQQHIPDFNTVLTNKALAGDVNALKFAYELSGRHDPNHKEVLDLQVIVNSLLEVITRNIKDPAMLMQIQSELQLTLVAKNVIKGEITNGNPHR